MSAFRAARPVRTIVCPALRNLIRGRSRSAIAVVGLAIGVCSAVLLLAVTTSFNGQLAGNLLGQAVTVEVRGVDYAAVVVMLALGVFGVTDVLYLSSRLRLARGSARLPRCCLPRPCHVGWRQRLPKIDRYWPG